MQIEALQEVLLAAASERTQDGTLKVLVGGLAAEPEVALARIWLIGPGDVCADCRLRPECPDRERCLHLVASDGRSRETGDPWTRLDGGYRRFPLGVRKIGRIGGVVGGPILVPDVSKDESWIAHPPWARAEGIVSFAGQPLVVDGETIGVLGVFSREQIGEEAFRSVRVFADHAAAAISRARAYDEINRLREQLERENEYLRDEVNEAAAFGDIVGASPALRRVLQQVELVAPTDANVLIQGESGTGKELLARSIHDRSRRSGRPMIKVNCASIPKELFESEFFGHVKGSFTGAIKDRVGRFELADGGTLFLDEVGEIPVDLQSKLLRVLQEGEFERVGDAATRQVERPGHRRDQPRPPDRDPRGPLPGGPPLPAQRLSHRGPALAGAHRGHRAPGPALRSRRQRDSRPASRLAHPPASRRPAGLRLAGQRPRAAARHREGHHHGGRGTRRRGRAAGRRPAEDASATVGQVIPLAKLKKLEEASIRAALKRTRGKLYGPGGAAEQLGVKPSTLASRMKSLGIEKP